MQLRVTALDGREYVVPPGSDAQRRHPAAIVSDAARARLGRIPDEQLLVHMLPAGHEAAWLTLSSVVTAYTLD